MFLTHLPAFLLGISAGLTARGLWWMDQEWLQISEGGDLATLQ
jgi:hypothetical protein